MLYLSGVISVSVSFRAVSPLKNFLSHKVRRLQVLLKRQTVDRLFHLLQIFHFLVHKSNLHFQ